MAASTRSATLPVPLPSNVGIPLFTPKTSVVFVLALACAMAWGKPSLKPWESSIPLSPSAELQDNEQESEQDSEEIVPEFLPDASEMEADLAPVDASTIWTPSITESFLPHSQQPLSDFQAQYKCRYCAKTCKAKGSLTRHENKCKIRRQPSRGKPPPSVSPSPEDVEPLDEEPALTLAECSRLISAYVEHPEWQDFLDSGRHATTQKTAVRTGWNELKLDTVCPADKETPYPALTPDALETLKQLSPAIDRLYQQLQTGKDPLENRDDLRAFINNADQDKGEYFAGGNHSLVIKWHNGPGYVFKIARSRQDSTRLIREKNLYLWLRIPDNVLLNLTTTPVRAAFSVHGKPVLALRQVDGTARDRLLLMRKHSLYERLDFALYVIFHFCQMYRRFLDKGVLLTDRHDDNIGFNEIPLQGRKSARLDKAILQVPVMLDLDPYWFEDQESREMQLQLPTWVPVVAGLLEEVFTPADNDNQISKSRVKVIDQLRQLASPDFSSSSSSPASPESEKVDRESILQSCVNHWFHEINPEYSRLLAEARSHVEPLLTGLNKWDPAPRTVAEWNTRLLKDMEELLQWLNNWKNKTKFPLLKDFTDKGIIRTPTIQGGTSPRDQEILTLLSVVHCKLGCQNCSRTFTTTAALTRHCQHHQQKKLKHCKACGGDFTRITMHERVHTGEKPYRCTICDSAFVNTGNLQNHLRTHSDDKPFKCKHCGKRFLRSDHLQAHLRSHSRDKSFKCRFCNKCFGHASTLERHIRTHSGDKPYKCQHCDKDYSFASSLKDHLRIHSGDRPYKCSYCGKCFAYANSLRRHILTHTGKKPYKCQLCGKCFSQSNHLKEHLRTHSGEKLYRCEHCDKCFSQNTHKQRHLKTHSDNNP